MIEKEFYILIREIIKSDDFQKMKDYRHHVKKSVFDHSVKVAWLCYRHAKRHGTRTDIRRFVRGALLHDFYLYDWHDKLPEYKHHGIMHPRRALKNAMERYGDLETFEVDMIRRHMFPLTITPPKTREGWLICFYDKIAAVSDYCGKNEWKRRNEYGSETAEELCPSFS